MRVSREAKIGFFLGIALVILATFIFVVGDLSRLFKPAGYPLLSSFDSALGIERHTAVRMAGVKIGYVKNIRLVKNKAQITMSIFPSIAVPRGSKAALASLGLLGEKYIEIFPGEEEIDYKPGEEIPSLPSVSFDQLGLLLVSIGEEIKEMSSSLRSLLGPKEKENLSLALENLSTASQEMSHFLQRSRPEIEVGITNFSQTTTKVGEEVRSLADRLRQVASSVDRFLEANTDELNESLSRIRELSEQFKTALQSLDRILNNLERGEGTAGRLLHDPQLYEEAEKTVTRVAGITERLGRMSLDPEIRADYLSAAEELRAQFSLSLWPKGREGRSFFTFGLVRASEEEGFLWNLQGGAKVGHFRGRAGLFESELGAGLEAEAVTNRLFFSLEGFAFNREAGPKWRFLSRYQLSRNFYFLLGIDDIRVARKRSLILGFGAGR